ncbi:CHAD domain-containing protein [Phenylobacterium sp.]|uniref:CYTH and CHAD domain-containing protein n=1 Tax=Phenylobacterium sp. TaxID=1871053 RepID=UPI0035AEFF6E
MSDGREIELKFLCEPADAAALLAAAPAGEDEVRDLVSTYFDTPDQTLRKAGVSLRIRQAGGKRVQTLKRGEGFSREEHEEVLNGANPGLDLDAVAPLMPGDVPDDLGAVFDVRVQRRQRQLKLGGAEIELALDQGEIQGGAAVKPICELELELKAGDPQALFALARDLGKAAPLYRCFEGKAAQGRALVDGVLHEPRRSDKARLGRSATVAKGFQAIARNALAQIASNAVIQREAPSPGAVHQIRVGARRLKSALSVFEQILDEPGASHLRGEIEWLGGACAEARALDVLLAETIEPALAHGRWNDGASALADLAETLEAARKRAHAKTAATLASARFRALVLDAEAWVETGVWLSDKDAAERRAAPIGPFAARALDRRFKKLAKAGRDIARQDDEGRHRARIQAKKLRYAAEAFAPLFDDKAAQRFIRGIKALQDELGALNDEAGLAALFAELPLDGPALFAAGRLVGEAGGRKRRRVRRAARALDAVLDAEPFWRG